MPATLTSKPRHWGALCWIAVALTASSVGAEPPRQVVRRTLGIHARLPLTFEANVGQTDPEVTFLASGRGFRVFLTATAAVLALRGPASPSPEARADGEARSILRMELVDSSTTPRVSGLDDSTARSHYFIGNDPGRWRTDVPQYARVQYRDVYPGVDVIYSGKHGTLKRDFVIASGADPTPIRLRFAGVAGDLRIDVDGSLVVPVRGGEVRLGRPFIYQEVDGTSQPVMGGYTVASTQDVAFKVGPYDPSRTLVIDPAITFASYLGGSGGDGGTGIAVDGAGNVYVTGQTESTDFPTVNAVQPAKAGTTNVFVSKLDPSGTALLYSTYLGGSAEDRGHGIAVDSAGSAYVVGRTSSTNFPTTPGAVLGSYRGGMFDAFVVKLSADGTALDYATYLGGFGNDAGFGIAVDAAGNAYVTGGTRSDDYPITAGAVQQVSGGGLDAFVTKLDPTGTTLVYSSYLGGSFGDRGDAIAVDADGNAYVTGHTESPDFPTASALQPVFGGGFSDAFIAKLSADGATLLYATFLGGSGEDAGTGIAVSSTGSAYITGYTESTDFVTTPNAFQSANAGFRDAFVAALNPAGDTLMYSTYLGGSRSENLGRPGANVGGIAVDGTGAAYVTGATRSSDFPTADAVQPGYGGGLDDTFVAKFDSSGGLVYSSFLGGGSSDLGTGIAVGARGTVYIVGETGSDDFPTLNAFQPAAAGGGDAFVVRITDVVSEAADLALVMEVPEVVTPGSEIAYSITVINNGPGGATALLTDELPDSVTFLSCESTADGVCDGVENQRTVVFPALPSGAAAMVTLVARVSDTVEEGTPITNTAIVTSETADPDPDNNTVAATTMVSLPSAPENNTVIAATRVSLPAHRPLAAASEEAL